MAKKSYITNEQLITFAERYLIERCNGDGCNFKIPEFTKYIQNNGFSLVNAVQIRRKQDLREFIEAHKLQDNTEEIIVSAAYTTLDVVAFIDKNHSEKSLKEALTKLDTYYRSVASSANMVLQDFKSREEEMKKLVSANKQLAKEVETLKSSSKTEKKSRKDFVKELDVYKKLVETYVYP